MKQEIQNILNNHDPALEPEILEYLGSILDDVSEPLDEDERETLQTTLEQFLNPSDCEVILAMFSSNIPTTQRSADSLALSPKRRDVQVGEKINAEHRPARESAEVDADESSEQPPESNNKSQKESRKQRREAKRSRGKKVAPSSESQQDGAKPKKAELIDDLASAWQERQEEGKLWGGRGHGGRGVRYTGENYDNIHLPSVSLHFEGNELLVDSPMDIVRGHRYGLLGRNGVGKSTLLKQLAARGIPGVPHGMRILLVQQQIQGRDDQTALEALVEADTDRTALLEEMQQVETEIEHGENLEDNAQRLGEIAVELDAIDADGAEERAKDILKGLSFTEAMINGPTENLSESMMSVIPDWLR